MPQFSPIVAIVACTSLILHRWPFWNGCPLAPSKDSFAVDDTHEDIVKIHPGHTLYRWGVADICLAIYALLIIQIFIFTFGCFKIFQERSQLTQTKAVATTFAISGPKATVAFDEAAYSGYRSLPSGRPLTKDYAAEFFYMGDEAETLSPTSIDHDSEHIDFETDVASVASADTVRPKQLEKELAAAMMDVTVTPLCPCGSVRTGSLEMQGKDTTTRSSIDYGSQIEDVTMLPIATMQRVNRSGESTLATLSAAARAAAPLNPEDCQMDFSVTCLKEGTHLRTEVGVPSSSDVIPLRSHEEVCSWLGLVPGYD